MMPEYLLLKRDLYYRPNRKGYTGIKAHAGRYEASEALPDAGVTAIHEKDATEFSKACWDDIKVEYLIGQRNCLLAALTPSPETKAAYIGEVPDTCPACCSFHAVSWIATKEIMALIRKQAGVE